MATYRVEVFVKSDTPASELTTAARLPEWKPSSEAFYAFVEVEALGPQEAKAFVTKQMLAAHGAFPRGFRVRPLHKIES